jgi:putative hydrolase of the HAD superfamily
MYKHLFFDLDHTLWDFETNSSLSLEKIYYDQHLQAKGIPSFEEFLTCYKEHNDKLWDRYRKGFIKQDELRWKRIWHTLLDFKIGEETLARDLAQQYLDLLPTRTALFPNTMEVLTYLQQKNYQMHLLTNGFEDVQHAKIKYSNIAPFFTHIITSEGSNSVKPNKEIFDHALFVAKATIEESIMIGDNVEVDIQGAANAGWKQVWVNHTNEQTSFVPTHSITDLIQLKELF